YTTSIFIEWFIRDLGLSRTLVSSLYTLGTLCGGLAMGLVGRWVDRRGVRLVATVTSLLFGVACLFMSVVNGAWMLGLGFVLIRMLGQGSLSLVSSNAINRWWVRRRGTVMGVAGVATALLGVGTFPNLVHSLIASYDWRVAYRILGVAVWVIVVPLTALLFRNSPEEHGLLPDGGLAAANPPTAGRKPARAAWVEEHWTLGEAVRTRAFWIVAAGLASMSMLGTGLTFHMVSIFEDSALSASVAAGAFVPVAMAAAGVRLTGGYLVDRFGVRWLLVAALVFQAIALVMAPALSTRQIALAYGVVLGAMQGLQAAVSSVVWPMYYGRQHLGSITGVASMILIVASALGPMPMGIARDLLGNYRVALTVAAALPLLLAVGTVTLKHPTRKALHPRA
ncbi:MAG: MFS transporter, partial [Anaerolineae bacterium]